MKKTRFALLLIAVISVLFQTNIFAARPIKIIVGGEQLKTDVEPIIVDSRTMLPVRAVFESIGAKVGYDDKDRRVTATKKDRTIELVIDSNIMTINGEEKILDVPAMIVNSRTLVPVRACAEAFDLDVEWIDKTRTVKIKKEVSLISEVSNSKGIIKKYDYDENGNEIYYETSGGFWRSHEYDKDGNLICEKTSDGLVVEYTYDENGNLIYKENDKGDWTKYSYDENGNLVYEELPNGIWVKYSYGDDGHLTYKENSKGWKWQFNAFGDVIRYDYDDNWTKYTYDDNRHLLYLEESSGVWYKYTYDEKGNMTYEEYSDGSWYKYTYDENDNLIYEERPGGVWIKYTYDDNGNEISYEHSGGSWGKSTYDDNGNKILSEYSDGDRIKYIIKVK